MKRFIQIAALLCTLVVGAAALALIVSQTAWFKDWLRGFIVRQADGYVNGRLTIDRLGGNLFFGVELENVRLTMGGEPVVAIEDVGLDYNILNFISRGIVLDDIRLNRPVVHLERRLHRRRPPGPHDDGCTPGRACPLTAGADAVCRSSRPGGDAGH